MIKSIFKINAVGDGFYFHVSSETIKINLHLKINAKDKISLDAVKDILLESGQSKEYADGKNSNAGAQIGVGVTVGVQTGAYVYAEADYGKGSNHLESTTQILNPFLHKL